jgi:[glutamine synthetase] adenylyltransferase / [glutamine synthetase]-adenylyl-L-tyrosine phosphorylase
VLTPEMLGRTFADAPDPELARVAFSRVGDDPAAREALARPEITQVAARLLGFSNAAADFFVANPGEVEALADVTARDAHTLRAELAGDVERLGSRGGLRRFRRRAMMRVAARDLAGAGLDDVIAEISEIADACIAEALSLTDHAALAVIGLGKLGGHELNYASDVDLLFLHAESGRAAQEAAERAVASLTAMLAEPTAEGLALRVDVALRPGGTAGSLSRSLEATLGYYARESATWERQAMIKARPIAGSPELGGGFLAGIEPFVYPPHLEPAAIDDVRRTKVRLEEYIRRRGKELIEVKRGRGGIRDVEFAVQLLQIVHGRRDDRLRTPNTLAALQALGHEGYVADDDATVLAGAYRFLRRVEHRLQIVRDLQTHDLPASRHARTTLARSLGLADADELAVEYERTTGLVRSIHERLFYRPLLESFAGPAQLHPSPGTDRLATEELLRGLSFAEPSRSYEVVGRLVDPARRIGKVLANLFPVMAPALALSPTPDSALLRLERIADAVGKLPDGQDRTVADLLANDPAAARRLAHVAAASSFAADLLVADPSRISGLSDTLLGGETDAAGDLVDAVARAAGRELTPRETGAALSAVAVRVVRQALEASREAAGNDLPFAVIGMGKLGARELNVASDLDLMFVYEGEGPAAQREAGLLSEQVLRHVREAGWIPDADLRPEGRNGPLARSITGYLEYWQRYAETWEFQALLRARAIAGDADLGRRFELNAADAAFPNEGVTIDRAADIRRMRERIERERVKPPEAAKFHFKLGIGSLADVQFAVELSLMRHGGAHPEIRSRRTLEAIDRLAAAKLMSGSVARDLGEAFVFCTDVKNALEMDRRLPADAVPPGRTEQTALARRLGYEEYPRQSFIDDYLRVTRRARRAMERVFSEEERASG